jgi:hypothetical protein
VKTADVRRWQALLVVAAIVLLVIGLGSTAEKAKNPQAAAERVCGRFTDPNGATTQAWGDCVRRERNRGHVAWIPLGLAFFLGVAILVVPRLAEDVPRPKKGSTGRL